MKKFALTLLTVMTVMTMGTMDVAAASPTVGTTETAVSTQKATTIVATAEAPKAYAEATTVSKEYSVKEVSNTTLESALVATQNEVLNDVAALGKKIGNDSIIAAATDASKKITATVLSVVEVEPTTAKKNAKGNYSVNLNVAAIKADDILVVLHYNGKAWETIIPSEIAAGTVTFETAGLSPISVVRVDVTDVKAAPKTGETVPVELIVMMLGVVGAVFCGKKYFV